MVVRGGRAPLRRRRAPPGGHARLPHVLQLIHPDDRPAFQAAVAQAVARPGEVHRVQCAGRPARRHGALARGPRAGLARRAGAAARPARLARGRDRAQARRGGPAPQPRGAAGDRRGGRGGGAGGGRGGASRAGDRAPRATTFFPDNCGFLLLDAERGVAPPRALVPLAAQRRRVSSRSPSAPGSWAGSRRAASPRRLDDASARPGLPRPRPRDAVGDLRAPEGGLARARRLRRGELPASRRSPRPTSGSSRCSRATWRAPWSGSGPRRRCARAASSTAPTSPRRPSRSSSRTPAGGTSR